MTNGHDGRHGVHGSHQRKSHDLSCFSDRENHGDQNGQRKELGKGTLEPRHAEGPRKSGRWSLVRRTESQDGGQCKSQPVITRLQTQSVYSFRQEGLMGVNSGVNERNVISLQSPRGSWGKKGLQSGALMGMKTTGRRVSEASKGCKRRRHMTKRLPELQVGLQGA